MVFVYLVIAKLGQGSLFGREADHFLYGGFGRHLFMSDGVVKDRTEKWKVVDSSPI